MPEISLLNPRWNPTEKEQIVLLRAWFKRKNYDYIFGRFRRAWIKRNLYPEDNRLSNTEWIDAVHDGTIRPTGNG